MTADERNRALKYGPGVPRSWIPDFNATHQQQRRAIRQGRAKPVRLKPVKSDRSRGLVVLGGVLLAGAAGLNVAVHLSNSPVEAKGVLREPVVLRQASALLALGGAASLVGAAVVGRRKR